MKLLGSDLRFWRNAVASTASGPAQYHPNLTEAQIRLFEMATAETAVSNAVTWPLHQDERIGHRAHEVERTVENVRWFIRDMRETIGACNGRETSVIRVRYGDDGTVHGQPYC